LPPASVMTVCASARINARNMKTTTSFEDIVRVCEKGGGAFERSKGGCAGGEGCARLGKEGGTRELKTAHVSLSKGLTRTL
jgi:hypothetical protein